MEESFYPDKTEWILFFLATILTIGLGCAFWFLKKQFDQDHN
jgi:hypothetical protein